MAEFFVTRFDADRVCALMPAHGHDEEEIKKLPKGQPLRVKVTRIRNVDHHRKYFALLNYAFDVWEPPALRGSDMERAVRLDIMPDDVEKNFDRFRKDIAILAGFYTTTVRVNGEMRLEAKSIAFGNMDQDEFELLYDKTIDVIVKHVLKHYDGDQLREVVDQVMAFDS